MKKSLLLVILLLTLLPAEMKAQNYTNETSETYNPYSPWHMADSRNGKYCVSSCPKCGQFYECGNMDIHIATIHPEYGDNLIEPEGITNPSNGESDGIVISGESFFLVDYNEIENAICTSIFYSPWNLHRDLINYYNDKKKDSPWIKSQYVELDVLKGFIYEHLDEYLIPTKLNDAISSGYPVIALRRRDSIEYINMYPCVIYDVLTGDDVLNTNLNYYFVFLKVIRI